VKVARVVSDPLLLMSAAITDTLGLAERPVVSIVENGAALGTMGGSQYVPGVPVPCVWSVMSPEDWVSAPGPVEWQAAAKRADVNQRAVNAVARDPIHTSLISDGGC
jgi:hypothetical protein